MAIFLRKLWQRMPPIGVQVDASRPVLSGGAEVYLPTGSSGLCAFTGERLTGAGAGIVEAATPWGVGMLLPGGSTNATAGYTAPDKFKGDNCSIFCVCVPLSTPPNNRVIFGISHSLSDVNPYNVITAGRTTGNLARYSVNGGGGVREATGTRAFTPGALTTLATTRNYGTFNGYFNGQLDVTDATYGSPASTSLSRLAFGQPYGAYSNANVIIHYGIVWPRTLSPDEIADLAQNPWQIFQPVRRAVYVGLGAGGGQSLTASLFSESTTFPAASIATGPAPQSLTASLFTETGAFYTAALYTNWTLTASLFSESTNFPAASISAGPSPQSLTAAKFSESTTFHTAMLSQQLFLVASKFSESTTFHPATLVGGSIFLSASLFSESTVFYEAEISVQILYTPDIQQIVFDALEELMAFKQNIKIEQGATFRCIISCKDADGAVVPLTGCTARAQVRYTFSDANPAGTFTCTVDEALGTVTIEMSAALTSALTKTSGVWDCEMVYAGGTVQRLVEGRVTISPEVTR